MNLDSMHIQADPVNLLAGLIVIASAGAPSQDRPDFQIQGKDRRKYGADPVLLLSALLLSQRRDCSSGSAPLFENKDF